jgi:L-cysteine desulfidase
VQTIHKQAFLLSTFGAYDNQRLPYACLLSTKGAYYVANKQASISAQCAVACFALSRDRGQDKKTTALK